MVFGFVKTIIARFSPGFLRTNPMLAIINAFFSKVVHVHSKLGKLNRHGST